MNKLVGIIISTIIGALILYFVSLVIVAIVMVIAFAINRIIVYRKKHRRFSGWEFKYDTREMKIVNNERTYERVEVFERFDRVLNVVETQKIIKPIEIKEELGEQYSLGLEEIFYEVNVASKRRRAKAEDWARSEGIRVYK